jgi:NADH:ubiquinone oxidoreductase subunit F (NADH-binding)
VTTAHRKPAAALPRLLGGLDAAEGLAALDRHVGFHGAMPVHAEPGRRDEALIETVRASGLGGRGGANFPVARKVDAVLGERGRPIVLINATEGEPPSRKDHVLLRGAPHLVIDGAVVCAALVGAHEAVIALEAGSRREFAALDAALAERERRHVDGRLKIALETVPDGFVIGEERALINALNGGPGKPTFAPPRPFQKGLGGAPTLVQNAETVAHLALIARHGAEWFRGLGTADEPGSALVTLTGAVAHPGVYEIPLGASMDDLLTAAGGLAAPVRAYLIGGYFGTWIDAAHAPGLRLSNADLARLGGGLGARAIIALPQRACGITETARVARYLSGQSAGQCGPCVHGLDAIAGAMELLARGDGRQLEDLERWLGMVPGRGACRHPDGTAKLVASALAVFADEVRRHTAERKCSGDGTPVLPIPEGAAAGTRR